jgi:excisionase family DNA binding protein
MIEPEYLTPEQVAEKLQMNPSVVRRMLAAGKLPGKRVGRIWRVSAATLREFIEASDEGQGRRKSENSPKGKRMS